MTLAEIIKITGARLFKDQNIDLSLEFCAIAPLECASNKNISYVCEDKYKEELQKSDAGVVLLKEANAHLARNIALVIDNPHLAFARLSQYFAKPDFSGFHNLKSITNSPLIADNVIAGEGIEIGEGSMIMPNVSLGDNVKIGKNCKIYPNVSIYRDSIIGDNVIIHSGSVIGCDGFGYAHDEMGNHIKIIHNGNVEIENNVEIGANTTIDRGVFGTTKIRSGAKIDNLVQIAHNCEVGMNSILVSQVGLAGSTTLGRNVIMGGQAGTGGHLHIGDFTQIAGRGAISKNLPPKTKWGGHPMMPLDDWMKFYVKLRKFVKTL